MASFFRGTPFAPALPWCECVDHADQEPEPTIEDERLLNMMELRQSIEPDAAFHAATRLRVSTMVQPPETRIAR
ncbi:hypothetical protein KUV73_13040 [Mameliella alba]|nr:hypothetical protein [Mameliella alba]MBY6170277.1 hypothetical protein [Mameliella alba]MBY6175296.1 hypothetical protein [Mameliella alba]